MKTVKYMDQEFQVPDWAKFIVADNDDNAVWVYESEPEKIGDYYNSYIGRGGWVGTLKPATSYIPQEIYH